MNIERCENGRMTRSHLLSRVLNSKVSHIPSTQRFYKKNYIWLTYHVLEKKSDRHSKCCPLGFAYYKTRKKKLGVNLMKILLRFLQGFIIIEVLFPYLSQNSDIFYILSIFT